MAQEWTLHALAEYVKTINPLSMTDCFNAMYPVGSVFVASNNTTDPNDIDGEWTLFDKDFRYRWIDNAFTFNTSNTQNGESVLITYGKVIEIRLLWQNKIAISDDTRVIATTTVDKIGLTGNAHAFYPVGHSDGLNAIATMNFVWSGSTGTVNTTDWVTRATSYPTTLGASCHAQWTMTTHPYENMLDSFCDKWYWKRTG